MGLWYFLKTFVYLLFLALPGLRCWVRAFSSCDSEGSSLAVAGGGSSLAVTVGVLSGCDCGVLSGYDSGGPLAEVLRLLITVAPLAV